MKVVRSLTAKTVPGGSAVEGGMEPGRLHGLSALIETREF